MKQEAIIYSLDSKTTFKQILNQENSDYDVHKYAKLQEWIENNQVKVMISSDSDVHYKIPPIRPRVQLFYYIGNI